MTATKTAKEKIFTAAAELPKTEQRKAFLDAACGADGELRLEVEELLAHDEEAGSFLDSPDDDPQMTSAFRPLTEGPGTTIGPYKLREQIGEGGFGVVYVAEQEKPVRRKVALKIIKPGMDTKDVIARFEAERQALALMDHPNVATVLDAGATESGRPYFVMELVHGVPITEYCDRNTLPTRERLTLFADVCKAIQHAHQKGIIHRDLKPSNIMVTLHDGQPVVKVIDFGVSKALSQQLTERSIYTAYGQMIGTPAYMSPEQAEMSGLGIDTRSDIYALGVLLYELLTGVTPLDAKRLREGGYGEMVRIIREEEPQLPSLKVSTLGEEATVVAKHRQTDVPQLRRVLRGELDWIVMKCLEKDRARRYETASSLSRDIERYLKDEPVEACPPSTVYRLKKFARRYRGTVVTTALVIATLLTGATISTWQAVRATLAERQLRTERDRALAAEQLATTEKGNTKAALDFIWDDVLSQASPFHQANPDLTVRALIDRVAERLEGDSEQPPSVDAAVRKMIGKLYVDLGDQAKAQRLLERALEMHRKEFGDADPRTLGNMYSLGLCFLLQDRYDEATRLFRRTLNQQEKALGLSHGDTLSSLRMLGACAILQGRQVEGLQMLAQVADRLHKTTDKADQPTIAALTWVAGQLARNGRYSEIEALAKRSLDPSQQAFGKFDEIRIASLNALANALIDQNKPELAEPLKKELIGLHQRNWGDTDARTKEARRQLAKVYGLEGKHAEAIPILEELLALERAGSNDVLLSGALQMLGQTLLLDKKFVEAEPYLRECLAIRKATRPDNWQYFNTESHLGASLLGQNRYDEALPLLLDGYAGLEKRRKTIGVGNRIHYLDSLERLVQLYEETDMPTEAARWRKELEAQQSPVTQRK